MVAGVRRVRFPIRLVAIFGLVGGAVHASPAGDMTRFRALQATPIEDAATRDALTRDQLHNPPYFLYELARRENARDEARAAEWFVVALARVRYDGMRCTDPTAANGLGMLGQIAPDVAARLRDKTVLGKAVAAALARKDLFAGEASPQWACLHGISAVQAGLDGKALAPKDWLKPEAAWPAVQAGLRQDLIDLTR